MKAYWSWGLWGLLTCSSLYGTEVNAIYWTNGTKQPVKIDVTLPENWTTKASQDTKQWGDYLYTKNRTAYMMLNLSEWKNSTVEKYAAIMQRNGSQVEQIDGTQILSKEVSKGGQRVIMGRFIPQKGIELNTQLLPYQQGTDLQSEQHEAAMILASAKIVDSLDSTGGNEAKMTATKKDLDKKMARVEAKARAGKASAFPNACAVTESALVKYVYPRAPQEIYAYYQHAADICYGKLHTIALHENIKQQTDINCRKMELTLQINHPRKHLQKTNDMQTWKDFMVDYLKVCPKHHNF